MGHVARFLYRHTWHMVDVLTLWAGSFSPCTARTRISGCGSQDQPRITGFQPLFPCQGLVVGSGCGRDKGTPWGGGRYSGNSIPAEGGRGGTRTVVQFVFIWPVAWRPDSTTEGGERRWARLSEGTYYTFSLLPPFFSPFPPSFPSSLPPFLTLAHSGWPGCAVCCWCAADSSPRPPDDGSCWVYSKQSDNDIISIHGQMKGKSHLTIYGHMKGENHTLPYMVIWKVKVIPYHIWSYERWKSHLTIYGHMYWYQWSLSKLGPKYISWFWQGCSHFSGRIIIF